MDFTSRNNPQNTAHPTNQFGGGAPSVNSSNTNNNGGQPKRFGGKPVAKWLQLSYVALLFSVTVLVVSLVFLMYFGGGHRNEAKYVNTSGYQAVFLNNGQVYFGHIKSLNPEYVNLTNIYYLQTSQTDTASKTAASNVSLVKLGCELHAPYDQMIINQSQVIFWENLKDTGQVVKAINQYKQQNPNGQNCSQQSQSSTNQAPATNSQPSAPAPSAGTGVIRKP